MKSSIISTKGFFVVLLITTVACFVYVMLDDDHKVILTSAAKSMTHSLWSQNEMSLADPTSLTPEMKRTASQSKTNTPKPKRNTKKPKNKTHKPTTNKSKTSSNITVPTCTVNTYVDYYKKHHDFPRSLHWVTDQEYQADFCHFKQVTTQSIYNCLEKKNIRSIRMIGDSQSRHWHIALRRMLGKAGVKCNDAAQEFPTKKQFPQLQYFLRINHTFKMNYSSINRGCRTCRSMLQRCTLKSVVTGATVKLELEYIGHDKPSMDDPFMNYLVTDYLKDSFPELLLWFPPLNHIKNHRIDVGVNKLRSGFAGFKKYRKNSTRILVVPSTAEIESKRTETEYINKTFEGIKATEAIDRLNSELYKLMESDLLAPDVSRVYGFHSLIDFTKAEDKRSLDGIHWVQSFYDVIIPPIISTFCESPDA